MLPDRLVVRGAATWPSHTLAPAPSLCFLGGLKRRGSERARSGPRPGRAWGREACAKIAELLGGGGAEAVEAAAALGRAGDPSFAARARRAAQGPHSPWRAWSSSGRWPRSLIASVAPSWSPSSTTSGPRCAPLPRAALGKLGGARQAPPSRRFRFDYYAEGGAVPPKRPWARPAATRRERTDTCRTSASSKTRPPSIAPRASSRRRSLTTRPCVASSPTDMQLRRAAWRRARQGNGDKVAAVGAYPRCRRGLRERGLLPGRIAARRHKARDLCGVWTGAGLPRAPGLSRRPTFARRASGPTFLGRRRDGDRPRG